MKRSDRPEQRPARSDGALHGRLVVSFVDRNWLWSRFGLGLSLLLAAVIAALALMPLPPGVPERVGLDKIYYFVAFLALVFPVIVTDTNRWSWVVPAAIVFGGAIELTQPFMGRNADWLDFGAGIAGVLAGAALAELLHNRLRRSVLGDEPEMHTTLPAASEHDRLEALRGELMAELRAVLREELGAAARRETAASTLGAPKAAGGISAETSLPPGAVAGTDLAKAGPVPVRVAPMRPVQSDALRRAQIALRAKDHAFDARPDEDDTAPEPPLMVPPKGPQPGSGASPRH